MSLSAPHDAVKALESYLGFWMDNDVEEAYEFQPINRTLAENKPRLPIKTSAGKASANVNNQVAQTPLNVNLNALVPENLRHFDQDIALNQARHLAGTATDLDGLYANLLKLEALPLRYEGGKNMVRGRGNPNARLLIIGDAPDADEDEAGVAFGGKAGRMLEQMLAQAGLADQFYALPAVFWRPAGNRPLTDADADMTLPFLHRFTSLIKPDALLLMGPAAVKVAMTSNEGIQKLRSKDQKLHLFEGDNPPTVRVSFHPSLLLKQPMAKALAWRDMLELSQRLA